MADITADAGLIGTGGGRADGTATSSANPAATPAARQHGREARTAERLARECDAMIRFALGNGLPVPDGLIADLSLMERAEVGGPPPTLPEIAGLHTRLAKVVAPASPRTIHELDADRRRNRMLNALGPLPNIRALMAMSFCATVALVVLSLSPHINTESMAKGVYSMEGMELLVVLCFLITAATLGACFNALFTAYGFISKGTYDTRFDSSYWMRIGLGVISGLLMAELIPVDQMMGESQGKAVDLGKPLLALLGGFSANLVFTVLQRLVQTVQSLFQPEPAKAREAQEQETRSRIDQQVQQTRMGSAATLIALQDAIAKGADKAELQTIVSQAVGALVPGAGAATAAGREQSPSS